jgi:hypothetical protein
MISLKNNADIILGTVAWLVALSTQIIVFFFYDREDISTEFLSITLSFLILPLIWVAIILVLIVVKKRSFRKLWWVWLSAPVALFWPIASFIVFLTVTN